MPEFQPFPKIARLNRPVVVTEKIDGTNGGIGINVVYADDGVTMRAWSVYAQSRKRIVTPTDDNFGFARWVWDNDGALARTLGPGLHFGEWWGQGIQRGYGLDHKRFSLFNTSRWAAADLSFVSGLDVVPVLGEEWSLTGDVKWHYGEYMRGLRYGGSKAAPGFMRPEGIVIYHGASNSLFKVTLEADEQSKGQA